MTNFRQGDVLCRSVTALPADAKESTREDRYVLAHGESGHRHRICERDVPNVKVYEATDGRTFISVAAPSDLVHEEHGTLTLAPAIYEVGREREMDHFSRVVRAVVD